MSNVGDIDADKTLPRRDLLTVIFTCRLRRIRRPPPTRAIEHARRHVRGAAQVRDRERVGVADNGQGWSCGPLRRLQPCGRGRVPFATVQHARADGCGDVLAPFLTLRRFGRVIPRHVRRRGEARAPQATEVAPRQRVFV